MENNEINVKLVVMAKSGNKDAISELCQKSMRLAYFMALKVLGNEADAEDIMSDTMITIVEKLNDLNEPKAYISWMNRIVVNKCKNFLAKNKPVYLDDEGMEAVENAEIDDYNKEFLPEDCVLSKEKREVLMQIINEKTTYAERMSILMFYYNDDSIKTIASEMNCAEITVKTRLASARKKIKDGIEEKFGKGVTLMTTIGLLVLSKVLKAEASETVVPEAVAELVSANISKARLESNVGQVTNTTTVTGKMKKKVGKEMMKKAIVGKIALGVAGAAVVVGVVAGAIALGGKSGKDADKDSSPKTKAEQMAEEAEKEAKRKADETYHYLSYSEDGENMYFANENEEIVTFKLSEYSPMAYEIYYNVTSFRDADYNVLLMDVEGNVIVEPGVYKYIGRLNKELFTADKDEKTGVIDYKGNEVIPFEYESVQYIEDYGFGYLIAEPKDGGQYVAYTVDGNKIISSDDELSSWEITIRDAGVKGSAGIVEYENAIYSLKDGKKVVELSEGERWAYNMYYTGDKILVYDENLDKCDEFKIDNFFDFVWDFDNEYCKIRTKDDKYYYLNEEYKIVEVPEISKTEHTLDNGKKYQSNVDNEAKILTISDENGKELCEISIEGIYMPKHVVVCGNYLALSTNRAGNFYIDIEKGEFFLEGGGYYGTDENGVAKVMHGSGVSAYYTLFNDDFLITLNADTLFDMYEDGFWTYDEGTGEIKSYNLKGEVVEEYTGVESKWALADDYIIFILEDGSSKIISTEDGKVSWDLEFTEDMMNEGYFPHSFKEEGVGIIELKDGFYNLEGELLLEK